MISNYKKFDLFWLILTIIALATSGLYSVAVSMMRIPAIYKIFHLPDFFKISLVIHVTLSINIWFMIFAMYHMQIFLKKSLVTECLKYIVGFGIGLIIISGFIPNSSAIIINYIPLINNLPFILGISLFFASFFAISIMSIAKLFKAEKNLENHLLFSISFSSIIGFVCLIISYLTNRKYFLNSSTGLAGHFNLEEFSWGIGHVLQFTFIEIGFLCLIKNLTIYNNFFKTMPLKWFLVIKILVVSVAPLFYLSSNHYELFTMHMRWGLGIYIVPITYYILKNIWSEICKSYRHYAIIALLLSITLNIYGGVLGFSIREINVVVPAHYHGSLIAITLIIMSFFYGALSNIGKKISITIFNERMRSLIFYQLCGYAIGNMMHITGLMMMGGYGALRKTPGDIPLNVILGKNIFMLGSMLSIISGLIFILIGIVSLRKIIKNRL